jgi:hypothetical protein
MGASGWRDSAAPGGSAQSRLPVSVVALLAATGVLVVASAYTMGRLGHGNSSADHLYWLGQALIVVPVAVRLLSTRLLTEAGAITLVIVLTVSEYLTKVCYSPAAFTYVDELQHWRSAEDLLHTGKLFTPNYVLPISPDYPGLEEATSALVTITRLPLFVCGIIVAGVAHLIFISCLYLIFRHAGGSHRIAGIGILVYSSNPGLPFFDSMFVYQTLALAFMGVTVLAARHLASTRRAPGRAGWMITAVLACLATVVTHNATSYILVATLEVITLGGLVARNRISAAWASGLAVLVAAMFTAWVIFFAPATIGYLQPSVESAFEAAKGFLSGAHSSAPSATSALKTLPITPQGNVLLGLADVAVISLLLPFGWWLIWKHYRRRSWMMALAAGSVSWYALVGIRLFVSDGQELAGRSSTFVYVPVGFVCAVALGHFIRQAAGRRRRAASSMPGWRMPAAVAVALVLLFDGLVNSGPPFWERLPGPVQVDGNERSVGAEVIAEAHWALYKLGRGNRIAADDAGYQVLGSYGDQNPLQNLYMLYTTPVFTQAIAEIVVYQEVHYISIDLAMSKSLPASGAYFPGNDPNAGHYLHPIPLKDLTKYNNLPGVARIYDSGNLVMYNLVGVGNRGAWTYAK